MLAAEQVSCPEIRRLREEASSLQLQFFPHSGCDVLCDISLRFPRPLVPVSLQFLVFSAIHGLAHQGPVPTIKAISGRFVWRGMKRQIRDWCRSCQGCESSKVSCHVKSPLSSHSLPTRRFKVIHVGIVGPLPEAEGHRYVLLMIDRFTRLVEVYPMVTITAEECCNALIRAWISSFGVPASLISDRGAQFTSSM